MKQSKEDIMYDGSSMVINNLEQVLSKELGADFKWEWRSVVGGDELNPIWSLTLFVEPKEYTEESE